MTGAETPGSDSLEFIARDMRTMLDAVGRKISLADWRALALEERARLAELVAAEAREEFAAYLVERVTARTGTAPRLLAPRAERA
ncbi:MAG: hypothetical protein OZ922_04355 [Myxococcales bacterium]|nr:hypothetical protein [Myxococcales bacterium]